MRYGAVLSMRQGIKYSDVISDLLSLSLPLRQAKNISAFPIPFLQKTYNLFFLFCTKNIEFLFSSIRERSKYKYRKKKIFQFPDDATFSNWCVLKWLDVSKKDNWTIWKSEIRIRIWTEVLSSKFPLMCLQKWLNVRGNVDWAIWKIHSPALPYIWSTFLNLPSISISA